MINTEMLLRSWHLTCAQHWLLQSGDLAAVLCRLSSHCGISGSRVGLHLVAPQPSIQELSLSDCPALQTTFTPLPQWEREYALFWQLIAIPLFRQHRVWKQFARWKKAVRNRVMEVGRSVLGDLTNIVMPAWCRGGGVKDQRRHLHGIGVWSEGPQYALHANALSPEHSWDCSNLTPASIQHDCK